MNNDTPLTYSIKEATRISSIGRTKLNKLIGSGELQVTRVGRRVLINAESLRRLVGA